ncbi:MAG: Hydroxyacylglutathione hydrolase [Myxococcaceae bacterium]|nr:Hydroxyacylglutathione hydrolase [Myxococcaceae bacterium]
MSEDDRLHDARIPDIGGVHPAERMFRVNWVASEFRSPSGIPLLTADYVSRLGRAVRLVDLRSPEELAGPLGYIPGSDWLQGDQALRVLAELPDDDPVVLVSRGGERAGALAFALEQMGKRFVAALFGGVLAWRQVGLLTVRDPEIFTRHGVLRPARATWQPSKGKLAAADIEAHLGDPRSLRWMKVAALLVNGRLSCVDGRDDSGVMGTPGGDAGEFLLALAALERVTGQLLDDTTMHTLLLRRLDAFGRFYLHTDVNASNTLIEALRADHRFNAALAKVSHPLEWRRFMQSPPAAVRSALLEHMMEPQHLGCGHLRLALQHPERYGVRPKLIEAFLRSFLSLRWQGHEDNEIAVLPGGHAEGAVVNIVVEGGVEAFSKIPLVSPMAEGSQMFINHPQVAGFLRDQVARFLAHQGDLVALGAGGTAELNAVLAELGAVQLGHTLSSLAAGLPIYEVRFADSAAHVTATGHVGAG